MILPNTNELLIAFMVFCRIGGCLIIVPGFSSNRIPMRVRLFVAFAISLACFPMVSSSFSAMTIDSQPSSLVAMITGETLIGVLMGLMARVMFFALQMLATASAMAIGFGGIPGSPVDDAEAIPALASLMMLTATALVFMLDLHLEIISSLVLSYDAIKPGEWINPRISLLKLVDQTISAFLLALKICSPFIIYSIAVNLAVGFANKMTPQIPAFFIATPFILFGGLIMFYFLSPEIITLFMDGLKSSIRGAV